MKIYTKTGDKGTTRLVDGECVEKFNPRVETYGTIDELNAHIGALVLALKQTHPSSAQNDFDTCITALVRIQHWLFNAGSLVATKDVLVRQKLPQISETQIQFLENEIDQLTAPLAQLKNFILPGGHAASVQTHICRTVCRRAERRLAELQSTDSELSTVLIFLNRLSDYFFTLGRFINFKSKCEETLWQKD